MAKRILFIMTIAGLMMSACGCTSKKAAEQSEDVAEISESDVASDEALSGDLGGDEVISELGGDEVALDEIPAEEAPMEGAPADESAAVDDFAGEPMESTEPTDIAEAPAADAPTEDAFATEPTPEPTPEPTADMGSDMGDVPPPMTEEPSTADSMFGGTMDTTEEAPKPVGLRKIADAPWKQVGVWVNAVYLARPGDSLESITQKIYGSSERVEELRKINPTFKSRDVKVGDKVYYNSPQRPTDNSKLVTYYEDLGLSPEVYVVNKPENIRTIAKNLIGDSNSWKELWSTNLEVDSKGELPEGTQLKYWAVSPASEGLAQTSPPVEVPPDVQEPPAPAPDVAAVEQPMAETPPPAEVPPPPADMAQAEPPPAEPDMAMAPPPPPPPSELPPPPPPPSAMGQTSTPPTGMDGGGDAGPLAALGLENQDQTMAMAAGAVFLFAMVVLFVIIRKRRSRRQIDFHTATQTQID